MKKISKIQMIERDNWLIKACQGKRILHIGCTDSPMTDDKILKQDLLHLKLASVAEEVTGLDIDQEGIEKLSLLMPDCSFVIHNAEDLNSCSALSGKLFDLIVVADVIEHISNIGLFLSGVKNFLKPEGKLLISTPQSFSIKRMIPMMFMGYENVHPEHIGYFSVATLSHLLSRYELKASQIYMFQWQNKTFKNLFANGVLWPFLWLTGGRLCDEVALEVEVECG